VSVINQMLRDLDTRQMAGQTSASADPSVRDIRRDTVSVASIPPEEQQRVVWSRTPVVLAFVVAVCLVGGWLLKQRFDASSLTNVQQPATGVDRASTAARSEQPTATSQTPQVPLLTSRPVVATTTPAASPPQREVVAAKPAPTTVQPVTALVEPRAVAPDVRAVPSAPVSSPAKAVSGGVAGGVSAPLKQEPAAVAPSRTQADASREVIAQAQSLWEQGSQDAAIQLLRDAVAVLERSALAGESTAMLAQTTRELTRMELARGHAAAAMELLQRLEPLLANQADVWAVRGNAAQRLGRHAESVQAYLTALKLRPGEARWMLGAAVSLAAEGHTAQAAELAEQARERGALSAEVESYLRQQGVVLRRP
jgi:hypothetical protein